MGKDNVIACEMYSETEIAQMFSDYVARMEDKPRHTWAAVREAEEFDLYCESEFPRNVRVQNCLFERMMNVAVEYEESGFIAGFKTAMALLTNDDRLLPVPAEMKRQECSGKGQEQDFLPGTNNSTLEAEKRHPAAVTNAQCNPLCPDENEKYIDTTQIAKMFGRTNWKTCRTISKSIIPFLTDEEKKDFIVAKKRDLHKKEQDIYKLTLRGCKKFLELCESPQFSLYANFSEGAELLKQEMERTWCGDCEKHVA